jgi:hypothetical protein
VFSIHSITQHLFCLFRSPKARTSMSLVRRDAECQGDADEHGYKPYNNKLTQSTYDGILAVYRHGGFCIVCVRAATYGATSRHVGHNSWAHVVPPWAHLDPYWAHLGPILSNLGLYWTHMGPYGRERARARARERERERERERYGLY